MQNEGQININGANGIGGGSGGSLLIEANSLQGNGIYTCNGGTFGGAGGRIAVYSNSHLPDENHFNVYGNAKATSGLFISKPTNDYLL